MDLEHKFMYFYVFQGIHKREAKYDPKIKSLKNDQEI